MLLVTERVSIRDEPIQAQNEQEVTTPLEYCGETPIEEPHISYFNRRSQPTTNLFEGGSYVLPRTNPAYRGSPVKRDYQMAESPKKGMSLKADKTLPEHTKFELPIDDEEFKQRVAATKLRFACQGKEFGGTFGQRPTESD